jgi:hypothetical protein
MTILETRTDQNDLLYAIVEYRDELTPQRQPELAVLRFSAAPPLDLRYHEAELEDLADVMWGEYATLEAARDVLLEVVTSE